MIYSVMLKSTIVAIEAEHKVYPYDQMIIVQIILEKK